MGGRGEGRVSTVSVLQSVHPEGHKCDWLLSSQSLVTMENKIEDSHHRLWGVIKNVLSSDRQQKM